jgi:hypothetical protein
MNQSKKLVEAEMKQVVRYCRLPEPGTHLEQLPLLVSLREASHLVLLVVLQYVLEEMAPSAVGVLNNLCACNNGKGR